MGGVVIFMFWMLRPHYPLERRLGGPQRWSGHSGEGKIIPVPARSQISVIQPIA